MSAAPRGVEVGARLTILKKGLLLAAIPLFAQLIFLALSFKMRQDQMQAQQWAIHSKDVLAQAEAAFRVVMEARSAVRSLALTGDLTFATTWQDLRGESLAQLADLRKLISDKPEQEARVDRIAEQCQEKFARLDGIAQLARSPATRDKALAELKEPWALRVREDLRLSFDAFLKREESLDALRQERLDAVGRQQAWGLVGGAILAVLSTGLLAFGFSRGIAARLAVLMNNVRRLAAGEALAAPLTGRDELSKLDRVFHEMADTLAQKDRENEMFVYSVSHDLRSPLVNLQGFSQELALVCGHLRRLGSGDGVPIAVRERLTALIDRDAGESIQFIQAAVRRLAAIIDALLKLSRVGRVVYDWQQVEIRAAVERVVKAMSNTIAVKGARVTVGELPPAWGDTTAIEQIFGNLLGNAVNYLDPARPGSIEVGCQEALGSSQEQVYYVKDNGLGIDPQHLPKVFLAFQRLHAEVAPGEGIGLPLVRRIVERHGGRIWVESAVGEGSTFFVTLPRQPPAEPMVDRAASETRTFERGKGTTWQRSQST